MGPLNGEGIDRFWFIWAQIMVDSEWVTCTFLNCFVDPFLFERMFHLVICFLELCKNSKSDFPCWWCFPLFPDHAVLSATSSDLGPPENIPIWRKPASIPWEQIQTLDNTEPQQINPDWSQEQKYSHVFQQLEQKVTETLQAKGHPGLNPRQKGRAQTQEVTIVRNQPAPLKPNRSGDVQTSLGHTTLMHSRWTRQLRRLQHYHRCAYTEEPSFNNEIHRIQLWSKIKRASGFSSHKGFFP